MLHAMIDIETLSTKHDAIIASIGAVMFSDKGLGKAFYNRICIDSCVESGLKLDHETLRWWLQQSKEALEENFFQPNVDLAQALWALSSFLGAADSKVLVWANWVNFDISILQTSYDKLGIQRPWKYNEVRCYGTTKNIFNNVPFNLSKKPHNALEDAKAQALHLIEINKHNKGELL